MLFSLWLKDLIIPILNPSPLASDAHLLFCPESKGLCLLPHHISQTINSLAGGGWADRHVYCTGGCINEAFTFGSAGIIRQEEPLSHISYCYRPHWTSVYNLNQQFPTSISSMTLSHVYETNKIKYESAPDSVNIVLNRMFVALQSPFFFLGFQKAAISSINTLHLFSNQSLCIKHFSICSQTGNVC